MEPVIWESKKYYERIGKIDDLSHPGLKKIQEFCGEAESILDVGCGDGTKLSLLGNKKTKRTGIDVSREAIKIAGKKYPGGNFSVSAGEKLSFTDNSFSVVVSTFVLEHVKDPGAFIREIVRVCRPGGKILLLAPNYGAPNRSSPNFKGSRIRKLILGLVRDFNPDRENLNWNKVVLPEVSMESFQTDMDTTVEPYLHSLVRHLKFLGVTPLEINSYWQMELPSAGRFQKILRFLGQGNLYPFNYWGPHLFFAGEKEK